MLKTVRKMKKKLLPLRAVKFSLKGSKKIRHKIAADLLCEQGQKSGLSEPWIPIIEKLVNRIITGVICKGNVNAVSRNFIQLKCPVGTGQ